MQEDKKKKIKVFLIRLLVVAVLVGVSIATYKVNLTQMLHDFVLRILSSSM